MSEPRPRTDYDPLTAAEALKKRLETTDDQPIVQPNANPEIVNTVTDTRTGEVVASSGKSSKQS